MTNLLYIEPMHLAEDLEPNVPLYLDILWIAGAILWLALMIGTTIAIIRSHQTMSAKICWIIVVLVLPFLGAAFWWFADRRRAARTQAGL